MNQPCPNCGSTDQKFDYEHWPFTPGFYKGQISCNCGFSIGNFESYKDDHNKYEKEAWEKWNAFSHHLGHIMAQNCIAFAVEVQWQKRHPGSKEAPASSYYQDTVKRYKKWIEKCMSNDQ